MKNIRIWALVALLAIAPAMISCWPFKKKTQKPAPPPPRPKQTQPTPQPLPKPPELPPGEKPPQPSVEVPSPTPPAPPPAKKKPSPAGPPRQETPPPPTPAPPAPAPQLRQILTPQQKEALDQAITARIQRARQVLSALRGRSLTREQTAAVNQIQTFISQAEEARKDDLIRANNLAERADVLAQDLMNRVR